MVGERGSDLSYPRTEVKINCPNKTHSPCAFSQNKERDGRGEKKETVETQGY